MFEFIILCFFVAAAYAAVLARGLYLRWLDKRQEAAIEATRASAMGRPLVDLLRLLGDPYEIESGTTGRELFVWKFPPAQTLPRGTGLLTITVTTDHEIVTGCEWKRQRQT